MARRILTITHFVGHSDLEKAMGEIYQYAAGSGISLIGLAAPTVVVDGCMHCLQLVEQELENGTSCINLELCTEHSRDSDCAIDPETGLCSTCGVLRGDACPECGGCSFHLYSCPEVL